jgi:hypothetical protein
LKGRPILCIDLQSVFLSDAWFATEEDFASIRVLIQDNHPGLIAIIRDEEDEVIMSCPGEAC